MPIGDFSRATQLSAKALRFYHQAGLLTPAHIDPHNGYRYYDPAQIADAQVIRHLRGLDVPLPELARVLGAPDPATRNAVLQTQLRRLESQLAGTQAAVTALRGLLTPAEPPLSIRQESIPALPALVIRGRIARAELGRWYAAARADLSAVLAAAGLTAAGPPGGLWDTALFLDERGDVAVFVPLAARDTAAVNAAQPAAGRARYEMLPAVELAVATHRGNDAGVADVYAALGHHVASRALRVDGPLRERYVQDGGADGISVTEIGMPIFRTTG